MITEKDKKQIEDRGSKLSVVEKQLHQFIDGFPFADLVKAATPGDGIFQYSHAQKEELASYFDTEKAALDILRFVPASGAATRMFKKLFALKEKLESLPAHEQELYLETDEEARSFFQNLEEYPFYKDMELTGVETYAQLLPKILEADGLNYGSKPKGMLKFHVYDENTRTAFEEHFHEAVRIAGNTREVKLHFTVSEEHLQGFNEIEKELLPRLENIYGCTFSVAYSFQKKETDTIAVSPENEPFRDSEGNLVFRPGGHGALIENLNELDCDVLYVNNIDNVSPDRTSPLRVLNKKMLGAVLLKTRNTTFELLNSLDKKEPGIIDKAVKWLKKTALLDVAIELDALNESDQISVLKTYLNRPVRVCGMVKNEGEAGGGPFFMKDAKGNVSLQIVEASQIDTKNAEQSSILKNSTHFNPVDLVCSLKDYKGVAFNLSDYIDHSTGFISEKSVQGKDLRALELPGLWNGSMSGWITIFVEVPAETFTPVKTVFDLLRESHRS